MSNELLDTTGARIAWLRKRKGLTQAALGRRVGVRNVYISQLESSTRNASRALIALLAYELGTSRSFLELETNDPAPPKGQPAEQEPIYFSPIVDELAQLADELPAWRQRELLSIARMMADASADLVETADQFTDEMQTQLAAAQLVIGEPVIRAIKNAVLRLFTGHAPGADSTSVRGGGSNGGRAHDFDRQGGNALNAAGNSKREPMR